MWAWCQVFSLSVKCAFGNAVMETWLAIVRQHRKWSEFSCFFLSSLGPFPEAECWVCRIKTSTCVLSSGGGGGGACRSWLLERGPFILDIWYYLMGQRWLYCWPDLAWGPWVWHKWTKLMIMMKERLQSHCSQLLFIRKSHTRYHVCYHVHETNKLISDL